MTFGKGKQTDMEEISRKAALIKHSKVSQKGEKNPNWKNGISKNNYHYKKIQKKRFPEKIKAREKVQKAIKSGRLVNPDFCKECGRRTSRLHAHHKNYSYPLKVEWLCVGCHRKRHE